MDTDPPAALACMKNDKASMERIITALVDEVTIVFIFS